MVCSQYVLKSSLSSRNYIFWHFLHSFQFSFSQDSHKAVTQMYTKVFVHIKRFDLPLSIQAVLMVTKSHKHRHYQNVETVLSLLPF